MTLIPCCLWLLLVVSKMYFFFGYQINIQLTCIESGHYAKSFRYCISLSQQECTVGIFFLHYTTRVLRHRVGKWLAQLHTAGNDGDGIRTQASSLTERRTSDKIPESYDPYFFICCIPLMNSSLIVTFTNSLYLSSFKKQTKAFFVRSAMSVCNVLHLWDNRGEKGEYERLALLWLWLFVAFYKFAIENPFQDSIFLSSSSSLSKERCFVYVPLLQPGNFDDLSCKCFC